MGFGVWDAWFGVSLFRIFGVELSLNPISPKSLNPKDWLQGFGLIGFLVLSHTVLSRLKPISLDGGFSEGSSVSGCLQYARTLNLTYPKGPRTQIIGF